MFADNKVANFETLFEKCKVLMKEFGGALVEEFIDGPEYTVLVATDTGGNFYADLRR